MPDTFASRLRAGQTFTVVVHNDKNYARFEDSAEFELRAVVDPKHLFEYVEPTQGE